MRFTAIDFETANSDRASACAVGLVTVENGEIVRSVRQLIRPEPLCFDPMNVSIHDAEEDARACALVAVRACGQLGAASLYDLPCACGLRVGRLFAAGHSPCGGPLRGRRTTSARARA